MSWAMPRVTQTGCMVEPLRLFQREDNGNRPMPERPGSSDSQRLRQVHGVEPKLSEVVEQDRQLERHEEGQRIEQLGTQLGECNDAIGDLGTPEQRAED